MVEQIPWDKLGHKDFALALLADPVHGGLWLGFFRGGLVYWKNGQVVSSYYARGAGRGSDHRTFSPTLTGRSGPATDGGLSRVKDGRVSHAYQQERIALR